MDRVKRYMAIVTDQYERVVDLLLVTTMASGAKEILLNRFKDMYASVEDLYELVNDVSNATAKGSEDTKSGKKDKTA